MRKKEIEFGQLPQAFHGFGVESGCNDITISVTEECNLRCKYCYLVHKNNSKIMSFETAKKAVDYILKAREQYSDKSVVWNFIGGEPLLEIELIDKISDYIKKQMYLLDHPWFNNFMFNIGTNGILYHEEKVQDYIKKNKGNVCFGITIDGNKTKHDLQRVYPDGSGSYDDVVKNIPLWLKQFPDSTTKVTFSSDDLPYLKESIIHLWNLGLKNIPANIVYEDVWKKGDENIFEEQLKELADYVIENEIYNKGYSVSFFDAKKGLPLTSELKNGKFCGSGKMLAIDCDGNFFPCIRFTDFSMSKKRKGLSIGDCTSGILKDKLKPFDSLTIKKVNASIPECKTCEVDGGCSSCTGFCYDDSKNASIFKKTPYHCEMHKANVRAIEYFWDKISSKISDEENPRKIEKLKRKKFAGKYLMIMYDPSISHCAYESLRQEKMSEKVFKDALKFAKSKDMIPVVIGNHPKEEHMQVISEFDSFKNKKDKVFVIENENNVQKIKNSTCILHVKKKELSSLFRRAKSVFKNYCPQRINIVLDDIKNFLEEDKEEYKKQLDLLVDFKSKNDVCIINVLENKKIKDCGFCGCGKDTFAVGPNGKIYVCAGLYFNEEDLSIGNIYEGFSGENTNIEDKNLRCVYSNKVETGEYFVESDSLVDIEIIEREASKKLEERMAKINNKERDEVASL